MKRFLLAVPVVVLLAAGCNSSQQVSTQTPAPTPAAQTTIPTPSSIPTATPTPANSNTVNWVTRKTLPNQQLFTGKGSTSFSYFELGTMSGGTYKGSELILARTGAASYRLYFLKNGSQFTLLQKYSQQPLSLIENNYSVVPATFSTDATLDIPDLDYPDQISNPKTGVVLTLNKSDLQTYGSFFNPKGLSVAFTDSLNAPVYVVGSTLPADQYLSGDYGDYYVESPDGLALMYVPSFFGVDADGLLGVDFSPLNVTWDDGQPHTGDKYSFNDNIGCDQELPATSVTMADLVPAAHDSVGDVLYEFKASDNSTIEAAKSLIQQAGVANYPPNIPSFTQDQILFWSDTVGQIKMLVNADWYDACGG